MKDLQQRQAYFQCNLKTTAPEAQTSEVKMLTELREWYAGQEWWSAAEQARVTNVYTATLLLFGVAEYFTEVHFDWTEAKNVAFATSAEDRSRVLATWVLLHPVAAARADAWLRENGYPQGLATEGKVHLSDPKLGALAKQLGKDSNGDSYLIVLEQRHGDMVYVPPGYLHGVTNVTACVKIAWDLYDLKHIPAYVAAWHHIASRFTSAPDDYMACRLVILEGLLQAFRRNHCPVQ